MKSIRRGLGKGKGSGYRNIIGRDPHIHSQSARGIKQPQIKSIPPVLMKPTLRKNKLVPEGWLFVDWKDAQGNTWKDTIPKSDFANFELRVWAKGGRVLYTTVSETNMSACPSLHQLSTNDKTSVMNQVSKSGLRGIKALELAEVLAKEKLVGGLGDNRPDNDFNKKELAKGMKVEMEHTKDPKVAKEIVKDHLTEFPKGYYEGLDKLEEKLRLENMTINSPSEIPKGVFVKEGSGIGGKLVAVKQIKIRDDFSSNKPLLRDAVGRILLFDKDGKVVKHVPTDYELFYEGSK